MLDAGDIAMMRATAAEVLDESCAIKRRSEASNVGGRKAASYATTATVDCHRSPLNQQSGAEELQGERVTPENEWVVTLPAETDVRSSDRLLIDGTTYEVVAVRAKRTWEIARRVECKRIG